MERTEVHHAVSEAPKLDTPRVVRNKAKKSSYSNGNVQEHETTLVSMHGK